MTGKGRQLKKKRARRSQHAAGVPHPTIKGLYVSRRQEKKILRSKETEKNGRKV